MLVFGLSLFLSGPLGGILTPLTPKVKQEHQVHRDLCVEEVIKHSPSSLLSFLAEVWEKEFDPIMVILRTVYRRDVQSAMDRYSAL